MCACAGLGWGWFYVEKRMRNECWILLFVLVLVLDADLPRTASWQDVKDHMRRAGEVAYAQVFNDGNGIVEFTSRHDMHRALHKLNGTRFRSFRVR